MVTKPCYVGEGFTRKPPKFERFIRPMVGTVAERGEKQQKKNDDQH